MNYTDKTKPGLADPYWYEWSVGQLCLVEMLNSDNKIKYVELQANVQLGIDDVVVTYNDGKTRFIQVKHTRTNDNLTFGDLVTIDNSNKADKTKTSLLGELAKAWNQEKDNYSDSEVYLITNRRASLRLSTTGKERNLKRPPLNIFLKELQAKVNKANSFSELIFPNWEKAWDEWCNQLKYIEKDEDKLIFLQNLHIKTEQEDLDKIEKTIKRKLQMYFAISEEASKILLGKLDHALREWTTSSRDSSKITIEKLYSALSVREDVVFYNHDLIPANPFFSSRQDFLEKIESDLLNCKEKVLFLSGVPGIGKTNIISKLCCKKDSIIDIRYYAYEPIDPAKEYLPADVSERVKKEIFWDTLLNQLRELLRGSLYKYKVPISNYFLKLEDKKKEFFRISSTYAKTRNRIFVIAIDGLDHAARAGVVEDTFLPTLPNPDYIPDNVKIIIAGQPKEVYKNYPAWLYDEPLKVKELIVPDIQPSDIIELVNELCNNYNASNKIIVSDIICRYAGGNTLAAIFSLHEALNCKDPASFEGRLKLRKLSGNIQEYYRTIWEDAKKKMQVPFVDYKIAGVFAFFNEPISAKKLSIIFKDEKISCSTWNNVLKALSPLLQEKNGLYTILHNDIRVFLSGIIGRDIDHVREIYSGLADYYILQKEKSIGYYHDVIRFLESAGRTHEFTKVYTPEYVISAYVNGVELVELKNISDKLIKHVIKEKELDWIKLRSLALGFITIEQIENSSYEINDASFRMNKKVMSVHPYECFITQSAQWTHNILEEVLQLINDLFENGEEFRGKTLFLNWFGNTSISDIFKTFKDNKKDYYPGDESIVIELLAKACVNTGNYCILDGLSKLKNSYLLVETVKKTEESIIEKLHSKSLENALNSLGFLIIDPFIVGIRKMIEQNRYEDIKAVKNSLQNRKITKPLSKMLLTFLKIITVSVDWEDSKECILWEEIKSVKIQEDDLKNLMTYYSIYAIVSSYLQNKSRSVIANEITNQYAKAHNSPKLRYLLLYFNALTYLGKWLKARNKQKELYESPEDLRIIINNLYCEEWKPNETGYESFDLRAYLLKAYILLYEKENGYFQNILKKSFERIFKENPVNKLLDPGMLFYRKDIQRMQIWIDDWLNEDGKVWSEPIGDRNSIVKQFWEAKNKYDKNNELNLHGAIDRARWSVIGFASHKEYSVDYLLKWYKKLVEKNPKYILKFGKVVKDISDKIAGLGDNRIEYTLNSKIYSDWGSVGLSQIQHVLQDRFLFGQCISQPSYLIDILIGYLNNNKNSKNQLLTAWSVGIGLLDWRNEDDYEAISALQKTIEFCALNNGITNIRDELLKLGPAYIDLVANSRKKIIHNQRESTNSNIEDLDDANRILEAYFSGNIETSQNIEVLKSLKLLHQAGKLREDQVNRLLSYELSQEKYGINYNNILKFLFEIGKEQNVNDCVKQYIHTAIENNRFYPAHALLTIIDWKLKTKEEGFSKDCLELLIKTFKCWITASDHIKEPELEEKYDYSQYLNFETKDVFELFIQILLVVIISNDADATKIALGGICSCLRVNPNYISQIERFWNHFHYRAKEWILMIYEFIYKMSPEASEKVYDCLVLHSTDDDFNAALYSKLLCENINAEYPQKYAVEKKEYFSKIPQKGQKLLIKTQRNSLWINGYDCVLEQINLLEKRLKLDLGDIEKRTAEYSSSIDDELSLLPIFRRKFGGYKVVLGKVNLAFFRILYKDWYNNRWEGNETDLARVILSASEPFTLLLSPRKWKWNNEKLFENTEEILLQSEIDRNSCIEKLFKIGITDEELIIAGAIEDYTYNQQLFGYLLGYSNIPGMDEQYALNRFERNARLFLKERNDYTEMISPNITLHQNGIVSFIQSNIMCGFSKFVLSAFGWEISYSSDGLCLIDKSNKVVGRFECYFGYRSDIINRYPSNQPYMQRWIVNKKSLQKALDENNCPFQVKTVTGSIITDFKNC